jgi:hypothetical protein
VSGGRLDLSEYPRFSYQKKAKRYFRQKGLCLIPVLLPDEIDTARIRTIKKTLEYEEGYPTEVLEPRRFKYE